ncbi:MAG: dihydrodipicolinate synthase family protein [Pseudomonadota bacterium]
MLRLPNASGVMEEYALVGSPIAPPVSLNFNRIAYAAAHVVADPFGSDQPWESPAVDWDATMKFRHHLWSHGFRIAEAMDTSQRGMGFSWDQAKELIRRSIADAKTVDGADLASGAGTDHLSGAQTYSIDEIIAAYEEQVSYIEGLGGATILMASRALAASARSADDYERVYGQILSGAERPVILHWLGDMFDPALKGYWGAHDFETALATVLRIINANKAKVDGIKISLLDEEKEVILRRELPEGVKMYTGDDFNYPDLIAGDGTHHSHALLGIFDPIAPAAGAALAMLADGDRAAFDEIMAPTVPLSRKIFEAPTLYYKAGVVFLAWLNGFQDHFTMLGGMQSARSISHYAEIFKLADAAGLLGNPDLAEQRMGALVATHIG